MRMVDLSNNQIRGSLSIIDTATSVDCTKDVRFRRSFRSLVECMVPACCGFQQTLETYPDTDSISTTTAVIATSTTVTGTFFGQRKGRISFCIQEPSKSQPLLLLEFAIPTAYLAKEMQYGLLRIALECDRSKSQPHSGSLLNVPVWTMYCNGRKVGFALKKNMSDRDLAIFKTMKSVSVGAGVLPGEGDLMYLRAGFERVIGSADSESFHMINPAGSAGQELSIFFLRS